jgi:hypothetical protein
VRRHWNSVSPSWKEEPGYAHRYKQLIAIVPGSINPEKGLSRTPGDYDRIPAGPIDLPRKVQEYRLAWPEADRFVHSNRSRCKPVEPKALGTEGTKFNADSNSCSHRQNI